MRKRLDRFGRPGGLGGIATEYNEKIKLYGKRCGLASGLGTTVTALLLTEQRYYIINVGDTRAYEIGDHVALLTKDQTVVAREVELGNLTQVEAETDPRRSVLLQCVVHPTRSIRICFLAIRR